MLYAYEPGPFEVGRRIHTSFKGLCSRPWAHGDNSQFNTWIQRHCAREQCGGWDREGSHLHLPTSGNGCQGGGGGRDRARLPGAEMAGSQHGVHAAAMPLAGACLLLAWLRQCRRTRKKIICPSSKWVQMFSLRKRSNCKVIPWETTFTWQWEWKVR